MNRNNTQRGFRGEAIAKEHFERQGFRIVAVGKGRGAGRGWTAYDLLIEKGDGKYAVNVKSTTTGACPVRTGNIRRLRKLEGFTPALLFIEKGKVVGFFIEKSRGIV